MSDQPTHKNNNEFDIDAAFEDTFFHEIDANAPELQDEPSEEAFSFDAGDDISYDSLAGHQVDTETSDHLTNTQFNEAGESHLIEPNPPVAEPSLDTAPPVPPLTKKSLFNKGSKKTKPAPAIKAAKTKTGDPNKLNMMILGAVIALLLLIAAFFLLKNDDVPEAVAPTVVSEPAAIDEPVDEPVAIVPKTPTQEELPIASDVELIDVNAILQSEIPDDPALIKEEIDRLSDKEQRLAEQARLIDEQLTVMGELTTAKEEQIALLEAQIVQLEAQKQR